MKVASPLCLQVPKAYRAHLKIGTSSWDHESWKGLIYDSDSEYEAREYLCDYARQLPSVEIDEWFLSLFPSGLKLPDVMTVRAYADSVPDDFHFVVQAPNVLTLTHFYPHQPKQYAHYAKKPNPNFLNTRLLGRFLETLQPMEEKIGCIIFQFEYLNSSKMESFELFLEQLDEFFDDAPEGYQYAVETRNRNYLRPEFFEFLSERKIGFVFLDGFLMPSIAKVYKDFDTATAPFSVVRLNGPHRRGTEERTGGTWNRIVKPQDATLKAAAEIVRGNTERKVSTYVSVTNHFEGSAPLSVQRLLEMLAEE